MTQWKTSILGCFSNPKLCMLTFCVPCYTMGKNAESVGEDCMLIGLLSCIGLGFSPVTRWRMRQDRGIEGSMLMDVLLHTVLPCCTLIQEAQEIGWEMPKEVDKIAKKTGVEPAAEDMNRA